MLQIKKETHRVPRVNCPLCLLLSTKSGVSPENLVEPPNLKVHGNLFSGSRVIMCRRDIHGQAERYGEVERRIYVASHCKCAKKSKVL
jgi:hypothetical protein